MPCRALRAIAGLAVLCTPVPGAAASPTIMFEPHELQLRDGTKLEAERGTFVVKEDRRNERSRSITIGFVRLRSTSTRPGNPIVYLAGGPGGSGVAALRGPREPVFLELRKTADVILLDQRGVGLSNALPSCSADQPLDPAEVLGETVLGRYYRETLAKCAARWRSAGAAIGGYDTDQSADDLADLRKGLGVAKIDLVAISYGTHLALATMRRHPHVIGSAILASSEGMNQTVKLPAHVDAAFARIDAKLGGGLVERMRRVHTAFDREPREFAVARPGGGSMEFRSDSFALRAVAAFLAKNPDGYGRLQSIYASLERGETDLLAPILWDFFYRRPLSIGMAELMDASSGVTSARLRTIHAQARDSVAGMAVNFPMPHLAGVLPEIDLGDRFRREVRADQRVLLLQGDLDVRTPLEEQRAATAGLRNTQTVLFENGGHDLFEAHPDVPRMLTAFLSGQPVSQTILRLPDPPLGSASSSK